MSDAPQGEKCEPYKPKRFNSTDVGRFCTVDGYDDVEGTLVWLGKHAKNDKPRAGVVFRKPVGKHNGTAGGHKYFECRDKHGALVSLNKVSFTTKAAEAPAPPSRAQRPTGPRGPHPNQARAAPMGQMGRPPMGRQISNAAFTPASAMPRKGSAVLVDQGRKVALYEQFPDIVPGTKIVKNKRTKAAWYVGNISREEIDLAVLAADNGDFLVRLTTDKKAYVVCVNDNSKATQSFKVIVQPDSKLLFAGIKFDTLEDVVENIRRNPINAKSGRLVYLANSGSTCTWFCGRMERDACEKLVMSAGHCDYLVRLDPNCKHYVLVLNDHAEVKNFKIDTAPQGGFIMGGQHHDTVDALLDYHQDNALVGREGNLYLRRPATRSAWYVGDMPKSQCEKAVLSGKAGDFLLRIATDGGSFVLCINDYGKPKNFQIKKDPVSKKFQFAGKEFKNIEAVVRGLKATPIFGSSGKPLVIGKAAPRPVDMFEEVGANNEFGGFDDAPAAGGGGDDEFGGGDDFADGGFDIETAELGGLSLEAIDDLIIQRMEQADEGGGDDGGDAEPEDDGDPMAAEMAAMEAAMGGFGDMENIDMEMGNVDGGVDGDLGGDDDDLGGDDVDGEEAGDDDDEEDEEDDEEDDEEEDEDEDEGGDDDDI